MDIALYPSREDLVRGGVYLEIRRKNKGLAEENPEKYDRLCKALYENVHTERFERLKNVVSVSWRDHIMQGLGRHSQGYSGLTKDEQKERNRKAFSLVSMMCCKDSSSILGFWREYHQMKKASS